MRKIANLALGLLLLVITASCVDLSSLNDKIDDLDTRVGKLESLMKNANKRISAIQGLIDAEAGKASIEKWIETEYGYELIMSDGSKLSLMHGRNGNTPNLSVTELNGTLYWTIDGVLMRDAAGNPIKAKAEDGKMPLVQVTSDGYWQISTDNGETWKVLRDENGEPVRAKGLDATDTLSITETDEAIVIVFDGKTFTISKVTGGGNGGATYNPDKMAIEYVAEYGVAVDGKSFATNHNADQLGRFSFERSKGLFAESFLVGKYHLPSASEWYGIFPAANNISFTVEMVKEDVKEEIKVGKNQEEKEYTAEYKSVTNGIAYGIKFIDEDNSKRTAYRYQIKDLGEDNIFAHLLVTARLIGNDETITLASISNEEYWNNNNAKDKKRIFPAAGYKQNTSIEKFGEQGFYLASDPYKSSGFNKYKVHGFEFDKSTVKVYRSGLLGNTDRFLFTIRPFSDY